MSYTHYSEFELEYWLVSQFELQCLLVFVLQSQLEFVLEPKKPNVKSV